MSQLSPQDVARPHGRARPHMSMGPSAAGILRAKREAIGPQGRSCLSWLMRFIFLTPRRAGAEPRQDRAAGWAWIQK